MLLSCYQCRQQLDVPGDSAGKRVRCPHCDYVIVVPSKAKAAAEEVPTTALPSMELDGEAEKTPTTKVAAQPLPPYDLPATNTGKSEPPAKSKPAVEDEPMPTVDRSKRRRPPMSAVPPSQVRWGRILGIGGLVGVIAIVVLVVVFSSKTHRRQKDVMVKMPPPEIKIDAFGPPPFQPGFNPGIQNFQNFQLQRVQPGLWINYQNLERRFKAQFPGQPQMVNQEINKAPMTAFEVRLLNWEFSIAHRMFNEQEFKSIALPDRFFGLQQSLCIAHNARQTREQALMIAGDQPGREWDLSLPNGHWRYVRTYYVQDGKNYHHYVLQVHGPFNVARVHEDVNRFFDSFNVLINDGTGQTIYEEFDEIHNLGNGGRRDNEFTALALHPKEPIAVVGSIASRLNVQVLDGGADQKAVVENGELRFVGQKAQFQLRHSSAVDQTAYSGDGEWLGVAAGGRVEFWRHKAFKKSDVKGVRFAFMKGNHLLIATPNGIDEYDPDKVQLITQLKAPDVRGLALAPDDNTLAVYTEKAIELWQWKEQKLLGKIDAHDAAITTVAFAPDGKTLASASVDRTIKLWNVETRTEQAALKAHAWTVWSLAFTPDSKHLASGGLDGMLLLWDVEQKQPRLVWAQAHQFPVRAVAFDAEGKHCYFTCKHPAGVGPIAAGKQYVRQLNKIAVADMKLNPQLAERTVAQHAGLCLAATSTMMYMAPDGKTIVTTTDGIDGFRQDNSLRVWDAATATLKYTHSMKGAGVLSPDGKWFVFERPQDFNVLSVLDVQNNRVIGGAINVAGGNFPQLMFTADSESLWVWRPFHGFTRYEFQTPKQGPTKLVEKQKVGRDAKDGREPTIIAALDHKTFMIERASPDGVLRTRKLYDAADGKELPLPKSALEESQFLRLRRPFGAALELQDFLNDATQTIGQQRFPLGINAINPDRRYAASTDNGNDQNFRLHLWDVKERRPVLTLADLRTRTLTALRFSPDGRFLAAVTGDSWTRVMPMDWLLERKSQLPCNPNDVTAR